MYIYIYLYVHTYADLKWIYKDLSYSIVSLSPALKHVACEYGHCASDITTETWKGISKWLEQLNGTHWGDPLFVLGIPVSNRL